jgi:tetratricopeptide (TPR) repeat protein
MLASANIACRSGAMLLVWVCVFRLITASTAFCEEINPKCFIERAELALQDRFSPEHMQEAIRAYEELLPQLESLPHNLQATALNRLAQLHYEKTLFTPEEKLKNHLAHCQGMEYGISSLRLNPAFAALEEQDFSEAVAVITDPAALLWTAHNWGALLNCDPINGIFHICKVRALYERCIEIDESYWGASAHSALGAVLIALPVALGGDVDQGRKHLERAIELAPGYLENRVAYAKYWGFKLDLFGNISGVRDAEVIALQLEYVLEAPIGEWPLWNRMAKLEAEKLLAKL